MRPYLRVEVGKPLRLAHVSTHSHPGCTAGKTTRETEIRGKYGGPEQTVGLQGQVLSRGHRHRRQKLLSKAFVCLRALHVHSPSFPSLVNEPLPGDPLVFKRMSFLPIVLIDRLLGRGTRERLD